MTGSGESAAKIDCSVIVPVYFNEGTIASTFHALKAKVFDRLPSRRFEVIFVDDGSRDGSSEEMMKLSASYPGIVRVVRFTRNFGQISAWIAGLEYSRGSCSVVISADGQDPVELLPQMLAAHWEEGIEIVACARIGRDEGWFRVATSAAFYKMMRAMSFANMPEGGFDFFLVGRRARTVMLHNKESHSFLQGQILWTGFPIKFIDYHRRKREVGTSRWTFGKKMTYLLDGVIGYSYLPIRVSSCIGLAFAGLGFLYALFVFVLKLTLGIPVQGWAPLMMAVLFVGGMQMLMLGIIGEYLWRALAQVRRRELYVVESVCGEPSASLEPDQKRLA